MNEEIKYIYHINFNSSRVREWPSITVAFDTLRRERKLANLKRHSVEREEKTYRFIEKYKRWG
jgi:hypothetical protein